MSRIPTRLAITTSTSVWLLSPSLLAAFAVAALMALSVSAHAAGPDEITDDATITENVTRLIDQHPDLGPPNRIDVRTAGHVVYLSGFVSAETMRLDAEAIAQGAPSVSRVIDTIAVTGEGS
jgi:osmotically-inducible protein OsmY